MESAAAVVRRWNPLPLGVQGVADFPSGSLVWTQLGYPVVVCAFRSLFVVRRLPRDNLMIMLLADSHPVGHDQICFSLGAQGMATVVSSPCLLPKVFDSSTSSATMPLFAPTGLTKACSLPSSLASAHAIVFLFSGYAVLASQPDPRHLCLRKFQFSVFTNG